MFQLSSLVRPIIIYGILLPAQVEGFEPTFQAWEARVLTVVLHLHVTLIVIVYLHPLPYEAYLQAYLGFHLP